MMKIWEEKLDQGGFGENVLTDLSKTFGFVRHGIIILKRAANGV